MSKQTIARNIASERAKMKSAQRLSRGHRIPPAMSPFAEPLSALLLYLISLFCGFGYYGVNYITPYQCNSIKSIFLYRDIDNFIYMW
jgi:hypothetical protein